MRNLVAWILLVSIGAAVYAVAPQPQNKDEQEIRAIYDRFATAFRAKDVDAIMKMYAPGNDLLAFDVAPPREFRGFDAYRKDYVDFFAAFPGPVDKDEMKELSITADGKLAFTHAVEDVTVTAADNSKYSLTLRVTDCLKKINGKWLIVHEHLSVPVDLATGKPDLLSKP